MCFLPYQADKFWLYDEHNKKVFSFVKNISHNFLPVKKIVFIIFTCFFMNWIVISYWHMKPKIIKFFFLVQNHSMLVPLQW